MGPGVSEMRRIWDSSFSRSEEGTAEMGSMRSGFHSTALMKVTENRKEDLDAFARGKADEAL